MKVHRFRFFLEYIKVGLQNTYSLSEVSLNYNKTAFQSSRYSTKSVYDSKSQFSHDT